MNIFTNHNVPPGYLGAPTGITLFKTMPIVAIKDLMRILRKWG